MLPSSLPSIHTKLHTVRITSLTKGEQIPVHSSLTVTGTSIANSTSANCEVSVIVNGIKPYEKAAITAPSSQRVSSPNNNKSKLLLISLDLAKNPIRVGSKEALKTTVFAANSNLTIAGASVNGTVTDSTNTTTTELRVIQEFLHLRGK